MGLRYKLRAFKFADLTEFVSAVHSAAAQVGGSTEETADSKFMEIAGSESSISVKYSGNAHPFFQRLSAELDACPWIEVRIQEGSHWDYSLQRGFIDLDSFSTFPQYWAEDDDAIEMLRLSGRPEMLSLAWNVPREHFDRYLRHWYGDYDEKNEEFRFSLKGKAYENDESEYCRYAQFWDFLRSLNIVDPWQISQTEITKIPVTFPK